MVPWPFKARALLDPIGFCNKCADVPHDHQLVNRQFGSLCELAFVGDRDDHCVVQSR